MLPDLTNNITKIVRNSALPNEGKKRDTGFDDGLMIAALDHQKSKRKVELSLKSAVFINDLTIKHFDFDSGVPEPVGLAVQLLR
jgi:hypothetical protein